MYFFELFALLPALQIDLEQLNKQYLALQKKYHPDFFSTASEEEQNDMLIKSSDINNAYRTLKDEDKCLSYILTESNTINEDEKFALPPDFLMEVMELNEDFDSDSKSKIEGFTAALQAEVSAIFAKNTCSKFTEEDWQQLKVFYYKKKYLQRILDR